MKSYPIVPGRGLATRVDTEQRQTFLKENGHQIEAISNSIIKPEQISKNIESFIGSVEIPLGLVGPLYFNNNNEQEILYVPAGTMEGALIASMNRGAKVVSLCGGFSASVIHQKMVRSPMFIFRNISECMQFKNWIEQSFEPIKQVAEQYSNHAKLQTIDAYVSGRSVHLKFIYTTGDASGQNMTTTCTWHAVLWINKNFAEFSGFEPLHHVIEGNGASDKKVSHYSMLHGRGIHVVAECELEEKYIRKVLRTTSEDLVTCFNSSVNMSMFDGMMGYSINAVNAIAAIFVATGQDLASIYESGTGVLNVEKTVKGLYITLHLPSLVIGTIGGGTHLPKQKEALQMMGCDGTGKVNRFAQIIAGVALSLEISTYAAIVGGQFAKAHEKLGRNKPVNWLTKSEINLEFLRQCIYNHPKAGDLVSVKFSDDRICENGIIIGLTNRVNSKLTGFLPIELDFTGKSGEISKETILFKSKPLDTEVIKGLHLMASAIDPELSNLLSEYQEVLEYKDCHLKEIEAYELLKKAGFECMPEYFGSKIDNPREIYVIIEELLDYDEMAIINSENRPGNWRIEDILSVIRTIDEVHKHFSISRFREIPAEIKFFEPWKAGELYRKFAGIIVQEYADSPLQQYSERLSGYIDEMQELHNLVKIEKTLVHNDFNPRNIGIRKNGKVCIYDWELAELNFPHRDVVEFLSFVFPVDFKPEMLKEILKYHFTLKSGKYTWEQWKEASVYSLKEYLITRVSFYLTGRIIMEYEFAERIFINSFRMIDIIESWKE